MVRLHPRGVNHLAVSTTDMKGQLAFWCDVLGLPLRALYRMHGVPGAFHGFVELAPDSYVAFVQHPGNVEEVEYGTSHANGGAGGSRGGTMQHVALHVDTLPDVLAMRDRLRSRGVQVLGPIDHGFVQSIYFDGPEGLNLEICCGHDIDERAWIDPEVAALCGIDRDELDALVGPADRVTPATPVPQPTEPTPPTSGPSATPRGSRSWRPSPTRSSGTRCPRPRHRSSCRTPPEPAAAQRRRSCGSSAPSWPAPAALASLLRQPQGDHDRHRRPGDRARPHPRRHRPAGPVGVDVATPGLARIHHFSPTVTDVEASATWYEEVFELQRVPVTFPHHDREETGHAVLLMDPDAGFAIGLHTNVANGAEGFDEARTGLDHISFEVADRATMQRWADRLDGLGVAHSGIRDIAEPFPFSTLVFRDPDNIQLELISLS